MSYLSIALQRQTECRRINQSELARGSGLSKSYISRLFSGESHELSDDNFTTILQTFAADPHAQAELIAARCMDALAGAAGAPAPAWSKSRSRAPGQPRNARSRLRKFICVRKPNELLPGYAVSAPSTRVWSSTWLAMLV